MLYEVITMAEIVVRTQDLTKQFGDFTAVDMVSFEIRAGEVIGYLVITSYSIHYTKLYDADEPRLCQYER